ncbi:MAG: hypothetical protein L7V86_28495 [Verrucomicrobiales bacterium]|nr:hypothetical protein [Verrucomicrobiales bacterium]MDF1785654.1 hypothetical protein [Verrucomicrobiales bacterium]
MKRDEPPGTVRPLFEMGTELPPPPEIEQEIGDWKAEAKRIVKRLAAIVEDHRQSALPLNIELGANDIGSVLNALREHAQGHPGTPVTGARDEIHGYCLNRLFDELVEEPSNILFMTNTGPDTVRYDAMNATFWMECLDLMETTYVSPKAL